jgi:hypothetical protein
MAQVGIDNTVDQHISCPNGNDGQITVSVSGMVAGNYYVQWENTDEGTTDFRVITLPKTIVIFPNEGDGNVSITSGSHTVTVIKLTAPVEVVSKSISVKEPDVLGYTVTQPTCAVNTGTIEIDSPVDDKGVYSFEYSVDGGSTYQASPLFEGLSDANYDISVKITSHTDCFLTDVVTINPPPTPLAEPTLDVTQPTCAESTATIEVLSPTGIDLEYARNIMGPWQDATTFSGLAADNIYTIFVRRKSDNSCLNSKSVSINPAPSTPAAPTATTTDATCVDAGSIEVTSPLGAEYEYSIDGSTYQSSTTFADVAPGDYDVTVRLVADPLCISAPTTVTVNAAAGAPVIESTSHNDPTTAGGSEGIITVNLVAGSGTPNYVYFLTDNLGNPVANSVSTGAETYQFTGLSAGNYTVYVTDNASCTSASVTGIILEDPITCTDAVITLTSANDNQTVCQDESITDIVYSITGDFGAVNVAGLPAGVSGSLSGTTYTISGTPTEFGTFNYTVTVDGSGGCLGDNASGTIEVTEPTVPTFDQLGPYCLGDVADALPGVSTNGITGSWSPATISTATAGTTTYNFTPDAGQCATTTSMSISVNEAPQNVDAGPDVSICEGESTQLVASADGPSSYNVLFSENFDGVGSGNIPAGWNRTHSNWGVSNTSNAGGAAPEMTFYFFPFFTSQTARLITPLINTTNYQDLELSFNQTLDFFSGSYRILVETSYDGFTWTSRWEYNIQGNIEPETLSVDLSELDGTSFYISFTYRGNSNAINSWDIDDIELAGNYSVPFTYSWSPTAGLSDPNIYNPIANPSTTTTYTVTVGLGGCSDTDDVTVTVNDNVDPIFNITPTSYCVGETPVSLPTTSDDGYTGTWDPEEISTISAGVTRYTFTPDGGECANEYFVDITVLDLPTATIDGGGEYCEGDDPTGVDVWIDFTGDSPWSFSYQTGTETRTINNWTLARFTHEDASAGEFTLISVSDANCTGTVSSNVVTVTENPLPAATLTSAAGTDGQIVCINSPIEDIIYSTTNATGATFADLPNGVTGSWADDVVTISGTPTEDGTFSYTVNLTGGCGTVSTTGTITVNPSNTITLNSLAGTDNQAVCIDEAIVDITYATTGATGATFDDLPAGVTGSWAVDVVTISGTPTEDGTFNYTVNLTGGCGTISTTGTITVTPNNTITLSSAAGTDAQTVCVDEPIVDITYATTGADGATFTGLPAGVTGSWVADVVTISGTPTEDGTFSYTVNLTGGCGTVSTTGSITINPENTITITSAAGTDAQAVCINEPIEDITYATTGATGATFDDLPTGVIGSWAADVVTISGTPTVDGVFNYTVNLTGGCGTISTTGTITVTPDNTITLTSAGGTDAQTICIGDPIVDITYATTGATGATFDDLPTGVTGNWVGDVVTISGTPTEDGLFNYTVNLTGGCGTVSTTGSITINPENTITLNSAAGTDAQTVCIDEPIEDITYATTGATGATFAGLPTGVTGSWAADVVTISGTPTVDGIFNYTVNLTGGCGTISTTGTIIVTPNNTITLSSAVGTDAQTVCIDEPIEDITYATTGADGATFTGLPAGVNGSWAADVVTISGTPTEAGAFSYTVNLTGGCGTISTTGTMTVNPNNTITLTSAVGTDAQAVCIGEPIVDITYATTGATGVTFADLPDGVTGSWAADVVTISGTPTVDGVFNYTVNLTGGCGIVSTTGSITVNELPTATIGGGGQYCVGEDPTGVDVWIDFTGNGPWTFTYMAGTESRTINGWPLDRFTHEDATKGVFTLVSVSDANCVGTVSENEVEVIEIPAPGVTLTSGVGSDDQTVCIDETIVDITYSTTNTSGVTFDDLPAGVTGSWNEDEQLITISGTPSESGIFVYSVTGTGECGVLVVNGTITVTPNNTITLSSAAGTDAQIVCVDEPIVNITYATTGADGATFTGLPAGVTGGWAADVVTISGTPTEDGVFNYTVNLIGGCGTVSTTGSITVNPNNTITLSSAVGTDNQSVCIDEPIEDITYLTTGADGATFTGLPAGVTGSWADDVVTISGAPTEAGTFSYTVNLTGGCGTISTAGSITVNPNNTIALFSAVGTDAQAICLGDPIVDITYATTGATGATFADLPDGVTGSWAADVVTISGTPTVDGVFNYTVNLTGGCGMVSTTGSITVNELPTATIGGGGQYCVGEDPTGINVWIDFTGNGPWTFTYMAGTESRTINGWPLDRFTHNDATKGVFTIVSVSDANCIGTVSENEVEVIEIETAPPTGETNQEFCAGATIADIAVTGEAITWFDAPVGNVLASDYVLVDGETYYATQTAEGCESQDNLAVTVTVYEQINLSIVDVKHGRCDNPNAGSIEVQATGGNLPYTYTLYDDLDNPIGLPIEATDTDPVTFTGLEPGTYYVIADDNSVCNQIISADIVVNEPIPVSITEIDLTNSSCFGNNNAEVVITATGGGGDLTYWFEDADATIVYGPQINNNTFTGLSDGNYTIVVEGENGCNDTYDIEIVSPDELGVEIDITSITCADDGDVGSIKARATGGTAPFTISLLLDGVEQSQFTDIGYNTWVEFTNLAPDNRYEVVINDRWSCGPATSGLLEITIPDPLLIAAPVVQDVTCFGQSNGEVTVSASGGVAPYIFTLFDDNDAELATLTDAAEVTFTNLVAGYNLYIAVEDANGCGPKTTASFNIDEPDPIAIDVNSIIIDDITCNGSEDGQISLSASGGTGDLYYTLTTGGVAVGAAQVGSGVFTNLPAGDYVVEITDDLSCGPIYSDEITISEPEALDISVTINNPLCSDDVGSIVVLADKGTEPYNITLLKDGTVMETTVANANVEVTFSDLEGGTYSVQVEDYNGCTETDEDIVINDQVDPIVLTPVATHPTCDPSGVSTTGTLDVNAEGGTAPYTFTLYNASGTVVETTIDNASVQFIDLIDGTYSIEVVDANGCTIPLVQSVINPATTLSIDNVTLTNVSCFGENSGEIEVTISGATGTPEFRLDEGEWQTESIFTGLTANSYTVSARDDNGCIVTWDQPVNIDQPTDPFTISLAGTLPTSISTSDGRIDITSTGGTQPYSYELHIDDGSGWVLYASSDLPVFDNLPVGEYMVIATDKNGCIDSETITLTQYSFTLSATDALCFGSEDGTITLNEVYGVTDPLSTIERQWTDGDGNNISDYMVDKYNEEEGRYEGLSAGTYILEAVTAEGADYTASITIGQPDLIEVTYTVSPITCYTTDAVGEVTFTITGGTPFADGLYDISWQEGETLTPRGNVVGGLLEGTYTFSITDANGCEHIEEVAIDYPDPISISSLHVYDVNCYADSTGEISVWATGNSALTYRIEGALPEGYENENNNGIFSKLPSGAYELFITDADGCEHIFTDGNRFVVNQPEPIEISMLTSNITDRICHYDTVGVGGDEIVYMQVNGGVPDYTYQWTNNWQTYSEQTLNLEYPTPGTYEITVTDRNNCVATKEVVVPGPPPIDITFAYDTADCKVFDGVNANGGIIISDLTGGNGVFSLNEGEENEFTLKWYRTQNDEHLENKDNSWSLLGRSATGYYAVITDKLGCEEKEEFNIPYDEDNRFDVTIDVGKDNYCYMDQAMLRAVIESEYGIGTPTFQWTNVTDNPEQRFERENPYTTTPLSNTTLYRVDVISGIGCVESAEATVSVYPRIGPFVDRESGCI